MSPEQLDLARRLVRHERWRWVAGMCAIPSHEWEDIHGDRVIEWRTMHETETGIVWNDELRLSMHESSDDVMKLDEDDVPDLADYATAAILLRMAMEAKGKHYNGFARWTGDADKLHWVIAHDAARFDMSEGAEDLGTEAASFLLEAWGEEGAGRRET